MRNKTESHCLLFDLDGTLADTARDLAETLNALRVENGLAPLPFERIRPAVSHGARALVRLGFGIEEDAPEFAVLRQRLLDLYREGLATHTRLFPGMTEVLRTAEARGIRWGVITNKPSWLTEPLMEQLDLRHRAACIVSGDSTAQRKPHPEPMLYACRLLRARPVDCLYIGDAERDIEAGRRAGMRTLVALFGYLGDDDRPHEWRADGMVQHPLEILQWFPASAESA